MSYIPILPTLYCGKNVCIHQKWYYLRYTVVLCIPNYQNTKILYPPIQHLTPINLWELKSQLDSLLLNATDSPPFKAMQIIDDLI